MVIFGVLFSPNSELLHSLTKWLIGISRDSHEDISMYNCITNTWAEFQSCTLCTLYHLDSGYGYVSIIHQPEQAAARFQKHSPCEKKKHVVPMTLRHRNVKSLEIIQNGPKIYFLLMEGSGFKAAVEYSRMWDPQTCHSFLLSTQMMTRLYDFPQRMANL